MKLKAKYLLLIVLGLMTGRVWATHYRAGEILYKTIGNFKIEATIITYSKVSGSSALADRDTVTIAWGDGSTSTLARVNGPINGDGYPNGEMVADDIKKNIYVGTHQYSGAPTTRYFIISFYDQNRMAGINNIQGGNSVDVPFYVEDTVKFPTDLSNIGFNSSPVLLNPPIDFANVNDTFYHNPNAVDPDGDSLVYELKVPLQDQLDNVPLYQFPDRYCQALGRPTNTCTIDRHTGLLVWAVPCQVGIFNVAIIIHEYRHGVNMGTLIRDMQIIVLAENNDPPKLTDLPDTCVRAGDPIVGNVRATDPNIAQTVKIEANGGPFQVTNSPATFDSTVGNPATGHFAWNTTCDHIRKEPYMVVFKATDSYMEPGPDGPSPAGLVDINNWLIRVIPPPVENLTATSNRHAVTLHWDSLYKCSGNTDFRGFSVWRKMGCDSFIPEYCETGLGGRGYVKITTSNIYTYSFTDFTTVVGQQYSYCVLAEFSKQSPNGIFFYDEVESVPSNQVCVYMPIDVPVITNVSVTATDPSAGTIFVRWTKPLTGGANLDTIKFPPPYRFELYRGSGFSFGTPVTQIHVATANSFSTLTDTTFTDSGIDTKTVPWSYKVLFFSGNDTIGSTSVASSVYLTVHSSDQSLLLTWEEHVPWTNDSFSVFRLNKATSLFDSIGISYTHSYPDTGLINDSTYCYYVKSFGHYSLNNFPRPLLNLSEENCGVPIDTVPPCPPVLSIRNDCDQYGGQPWDTSHPFTNYLSWYNPYDSCSYDITRYYIYFGADSTNLAFLDSVTGKSDTLFNHIQKDNLAGCYAVTALDRVGNQSRYSNVVCIDNCPYYVLPNTFTPNGDGANDIFHPFHPYRFVPKIEMQIFNRWGEKVFETTDPEINWNGKDQKTGKDCSEGVYIYAGYYYEQHQDGLVKKPLSGEKKGGGFIHLIRGK